MAKPERRPHTFPVSEVELREAIRQERVHLAQLETQTRQSRKRIVQMVRGRLRAAVRR